MMMTKERRRTPNRLEERTKEDDFDYFIVFELIFRILKIIN
jgi:hypothetical protein